jgi:hypothetical protein
MKRQQIKNIIKKACWRVELKMKIIVQKNTENILFVIARNKKIAIKEMKNDFSLYKFQVTINKASILEIGLYCFKKDEMN